LIDVVVPAQPRGIVLVLHGGDKRDDPAVSPTQPSVLRMLPVAHAIRRAAHGQLAIFRVLNAQRGWGSDQGRVLDARWALERAQERVGAELPVSLVGHSLGGRAALMAAGLPPVRSAVVLAPWVDDADVVSGIEGRRLLFIHGNADRVASIERARQVAAALATRTDVTFVEVRGGTHAMIRHRRSFDGLAAQFVALTLLDLPGAAVIQRIVAGERSLEV
jgi:pimeloyl-ACP methyl ester carboxylesterase